MNRKLSDILRDDSISDQIEVSNFDDYRARYEVHADRSVTVGHLEMDCDCENPLTDDSDYSEISEGTNLHASYSIPLKQFRDSSYQVHYPTRDRNGYRDTHSHVWTPGKECLEYILQEPTRKGRNRRATEICESILHTYNLWVVGEVYGYIVQTFESDGSEVYMDSCWGFIGEKYAREELKSVFESAVKSRNSDVTPSLFADLATV